jgi:hypothetical protein
MDIIISPEIGLLLLCIFTGYLFYINKEGFLSRSSALSKVLYGSVIVLEVGLIVGSRFVVPPLLESFVDSESALYDFIDIAVFVALVFAVFGLGRNLQTRIA